MFRLIKLGFYALIGYALYQMYQGMVAQQQQGGGGGGAGGAFGGSGGGELNRAASGQGAMQNITGPGEGQTEATLDTDGGSVSHRVGRGVVST